eukprot:snap_masked-scaffold_3-processed-gene-12.25-mRNA-1 protein AED:1.00 eAED:1.00 QI:0/0/0/0/1/1/2/0/65
MSSFSILNQKIIIPLQLSFNKLQDRWTSLVKGGYKLVFYDPGQPVESLDQRGMMFELLTNWGLGV